MKLVAVVWKDTLTQEGWHDPRSALPPPALCVSIGFLVKRDKSAIHLAAGVGGHGEDREWADLTTIPAGAVVEVEDLTPGPRTRKALEEME